MATTKVSALSALTTPDGAEELLINDGGTSKKITITNVSKLNLKGGDLTSASPLVIDTDGNYFDVTGTTNFAVMTVAANRQFTLQFDAALTMTHHATKIDLPGEANITTAAGDVATFQSTGANTVQCINYTRAAGTAIAGGGDVVDDTSPQLGGFLDANGNYIQMQKGGDISSASPTVIDTDGDYFICTGTTGFTTFTVAADRHFFLEFAAALVMTHGSGTLDLPGAANITTVAGDVGEFYSTASNVVTCVNYTRADGTPIVVNILSDTTPQLGGDLDCNGAQIQWSKGADVASATALPLLTDGNYFDVTGTATVTSFNDTGGTGTQIKLHFDGACTLTDNADILLPGSSNIVTAAGDEAEFIQLDADKYRCTNYTKADGTPIAIGAETIDSAAYVDGSIDNEHIADDAIDSEHYADASIDFAHIQNVAANSVLGRDANSSGVLTEVALATTEILIGDGTGFAAAALSGDATMTNAGVVTIEDDAVTYAKMQNVVADERILGRVSGAGGVVEELTKSNVLTMLSVEDGADVTDATNVGTVVNGKQTIWIPSNAMTPTESNGCAAIAAVETTAGRPDMYVLDFDKDADEFAQFSIAFPKMWNLGTITFQVFWSGIAATTDVDWSLQGVSMPDNSTIDVAYGTAIVVTDNAQSAVEELLVSAESGAVTIAGTPADNDLCYFRVGRDVSGDAMAGDARLHGVKIFYTTDALNDA